MHKKFHDKSIKEKMDLEMIYGVCNEMFEVQNMHGKSSFQGSDFPFLEESGLTSSYLVFESCRFVL